MGLHPSKLRPTPSLRAKHIGSRVYDSATPQARRRKAPSSWGKRVRLLVLAAAACTAALLVVGLPNFLAAPNVRLLRRRLPPTKRIRGKSNTEPAPCTALPPPPAPAAAVAPVRQRGTSYTGPIQGRWIKQILKPRGRHECSMKSMYYDTCTGRSSAELYYVPGYDTRPRFICTPCLKLLNARRTRKGRPLYERKY